jgi:hypothetical protein
VETAGARVMDCLLPVAILTVDLSPYTSAKSSSSEDWATAEPIQAKVNNAQSDLGFNVCIASTSSSQLSVADLSFA